MTQEVNINTSLRKGDKVNIYLDWQDENNFNGVGILIKKLKDGDSYYLDGERLKPTDAKEYSVEDLAAITKYNRLISFFKGRGDNKPTLLCKRLYQNLIKLRTDEISDFANMKKLLAKYRKNHTGSVKYIGSLLNEYDDYYIIRFIQQDRDVWRPSIFSYERWKVRMITDSSGWETDWTTARNIRILKCYNPNEIFRGSELIEYTTYCGISSRTFDRIVHKDRYLQRIRAEQKQNESTFIDDDEMDEFIESKMKK